MERPALIFDMKVNGENQEIKLTYGVFTEILQIIPDPQNIGDLFITDAALRDYVTRRMLSGSKRIKDEKDLVDPFELDIDMEEVNDLIMWVGDHVMYFFMNTAAKTAKLMKKYEEPMQALQSSQSKDGSET
jgi:hypothetical protein